MSKFKRALIRILIIMILISQGNVLCDIKSEHTNWNVAKGYSQFTDIIKEALKTKMTKVKVKLYLGKGSYDIKTICDIDQIARQIKDFNYNIAASYSITHYPEEKLIEVEYNIEYYTDYNNTNTKPKDITKEQSKYLYEEILKALKEAKSEIVIDSKINIPYNSDQISRIFEDIEMDYPEYIYYKTVNYKSRSNQLENGIYDMFIDTIGFEYSTDPKVVKSMMKQTEDKADTIIRQIIKPDMTIIEKQRALHDYIVKNAKYDYENYKKGTIPMVSYTPYNVLVKGTGVCEGYAKATSLLFHKIGIETKYISGLGNGDGHAWNAVKIDNKWLFIDTTWDDPVPDKTGKVSYKYFNLTAEKLKKDHYWDEELYKSKLK